jgi:hypothetical protein
MFSKFFVQDELACTADPADSLIESLRSQIDFSDRAEQWPPATPCVVNQYHALLRRRLATFLEGALRNSRSAWRRWVARSQNRLQALPPLPARELRRQLFLEAVVSPRSARKRAATAQLPLPSRPPPPFPPHAPGLADGRRLHHPVAGRR